MNPSGSATQFWRDTSERVIAEEDRLDFDRFSYADAWALGSAMVTDAMACRHEVSIAIVFGARRVFQAALEGSAAINEDWLTRKVRAVYRHDHSSWALECRQRAMGGDYDPDTGYGNADVALAGGAVPLRVRGSLIGAVGVCGLAAEEDHYFVYDAMTSYAQLGTAHDGARLAGIGGARRV